MTRLTNYTFVVIEDDLNVCEQVELRMQTFDNWKCEGSYTGFDDALSCILTKKPDLIFLDYSIRGGNSFDILDRISEDKNYNPYVVFLTGYLTDKPEIAEKAMNNYNVNKFLNKPIFEKLSEQLPVFIQEATQWNQEKMVDSMWIETVDKQKIRIHPSKICCISQSRSNPRNKIIYTSDQHSYEVKKSWKECENWMAEIKLKYIVTNYRDSIVINNHITSVKKPYIWLNNYLKVNVSKDCWKNIPTKNPDQL